MRIRPTVKAAAVLGAAAALTAGCLSSGGGGGSSNTGNTITMMYGFTGNQSDDFQAVVKPWAQKNNITINFAPTADFNNLINTKVAANQLPDIAIFPQPGIMRTISATGKLADLSSVLTMSDLQSNMLPGALKAGQNDSGTQYAVLVSANVKNGVYFPKKAATAAGLTQGPQTMDQLQQLTNTIAGTGRTPWCFGIEAAAATGWPATDWVEDLMVINNGSDVYNQWVQHKIPFNDPRVLSVLNQLDQLVLANGHVNGGRNAVASNNFGTAGNPMFDNPPGCFMYRQGNFLTQAGFFPKAVLSDLDNTVGVFPMPGKTAESKPVLGGGDLAGLFSANNDSAKKVLQYLTSSEFQTAMAKKASWYLAPRKDVPLDSYPSKTSQNFAQIQNQATEWVFDGSDQMPGAVGSGSFWKEMTAWISGQEDAKTALDKIEASWPK
ncbi:MAG: carbohydrate transporter substrate-binding protein [Frankiales bacterium]|nr:carbohydrate transporter substrate-binding protein [Frankiales bacterium]